MKTLGFTIEDEPIRKAVDCMVSCLRGERKIDNYWEKTHDWNLYTKLMLSTWVKIYEPDNEQFQMFQSIETSRYLAAIDILSGYELAGEKLNFVVEWLEKNMDETGGWDLGTKAKDNVYFPLSDSWRKAEIRKADYTEKILSITQRIKQ